VGGCAPRARENSVRPRRLSGRIGQPLSFTVRRPMRSLYALLLMYVAVLSVVGVASALFAKRLTPVQLNQWLPRLRLLNLLLVCAFIVVVAIYVRVWFLALPALGIVFFYPYVHYVRVCEGCGKVTEPVRWKPAAFCSGCGASLRSSSAFSPARPSNNRWSGP